MTKYLSSLHPNQPCFILPAVPAARSAGWHWGSRPPLLVTSDVPGCLQRSSWPPPRGCAAEHWCGPKSPAPSALRAAPLLLRCCSTRQQDVVNQINTERFRKDIGQLTRRPRTFCWMDDSLGKDCRESWRRWGCYKETHDSFQHPSALGCLLQVSVYLQHFNEQVQSLVLYKMSAGCGRLVCEVPECTQRELQGGIHHALTSFLTHDMKQLLQASTVHLSWKLRCFKKAHRKRESGNFTGGEKRTFTMNSSAPSWAVCSVDNCKKQTFRWQFSSQIQRTENKPKSTEIPTLAARMEMIATAILCMFWSSWLQSHCITSLAASNLQNRNRNCAEGQEQYIKTFNF